MKERIYPANGLPSDGLPSDGLPSSGLSTNGLSLKSGGYSLEAWSAYLESPRALTALGELYVDADTARQRYLDAAKKFVEAFGQAPFSFICAPGRTELSGNHTDHQNGRVLAAAVDIDMLAAVAPANSGRVRLISEGYGLIDIDLGGLSPRGDERNSTAALIRGVMAGIRDAGYRAEGFDAYITSNVPEGSGLSSSAAFEVLLGSILNSLYNGGSIPAVEIAKIGQYAENRFFGKPCGLMDQMASAVGGAVLIDFADIKSPHVKSVACDALSRSHCLAVVSAGGSHADLTKEYADITKEMGDVARWFGRDVLRNVPSELFYGKLHQLHGKVRDRAILRAMHFYEENDRVLDQAAALELEDTAAYIRLMRLSGESSFMWLQNVYPARDARERSIPLALAFAKHQLGNEGAWRVHGGGFAGTIQVLIPKGRKAAFCEACERMFGKGCFHPLVIRRHGGFRLRFDGE